MHQLRQSFPGTCAIWKGYHTTFSFCNQYGEAIHAGLFYWTVINWQGGLYPQPAFADIRWIVEWQGSFLLLSAACFGSCLRRRSKGNRCFFKVWGQSLEKNHFRAKGPYTRWHTCRLLQMTFGRSKASIFFNFIIAASCLWNREAFLLRNAFMAPISSDECWRKSIQGGRLLPKGAQPQLSRFICLMA